MPDMPTPADVHPAPLPGAPAGTPTEEAASTATPDTGGEGLPKQLLDIPAFHALLSGAPPATYVDKDSKLPEVKAVEKHFAALKEAGFGVFESQSKPGNAVLYNGLIIPTQEIQQADQAGQLDKVAVPFEQLLADYKGGGKGAPTPDATGAGAAPPAPAAGPAASPAPAGAPLPAGANQNLLNRRLANIAIGSSSPSSGAMPGGGRVINALKTPVA